MWDERNLYAHMTMYGSMLTHWCFPSRLFELAPSTISIVLEFQCCPSDVAPLIRYRHFIFRRDVLFSSTTCTVETPRVKQGLLEWVTHGRGLHEPPYRARHAACRSCSETWTNTAMKHCHRRIKTASSPSRATPHVAQRPKAATAASCGLHQPYLASPPSPRRRQNPRASPSPT